MSLFLVLFPLVYSNEFQEVLKHGSGVFTMTFSSTEIVYLNLCYKRWPSFAGSSSHLSCVFHPHPYNFTIHPEHATKIGRPLRNIRSDQITVSINFTDNKGGSLGHILETIVVDGSVPSRTISINALSVDFEVKCDKNFFGPRCGRYCKPSSFGNFRYDCTQTGRKVCLPGWAGSNCTAKTSQFALSNENRVISRIVRSNRSSDMKKFLRRCSKKCLPILSVATLMMTVFISCMLFSITVSQVRFNVRFANVVTY